MKIIEKRNYIIFGIIVILVLFILFFPREKEYIKSFKYDGVITYKIYTDNIHGVYKNIKKIYESNKNDSNVCDRQLYLTSQVSSYLQDEVTDYYLINDSGNVIAGKGYNGKYKISITNDKTLGIVELENESMVTIRDDMFIVLIGKNINELYCIGQKLSTLGVEEGKEYIKDYNIEVLWQTNGEIYKTNGFYKHIL